MSFPSRAAPASAEPADAGQLTAPTVRLARLEDMPVVMQMIQELAEYEEMPDGPKINVDDLVRDGFVCSPPWFFSLVAELDGEVVGHALCNRAYSSWTHKAFYIEDLYVRPAARRRGVALQLLQRLCQMAVEEDVHRVDWHVLENNAPALRLYERLGVRDLRRSERRAALRLDSDRIRAVAQCNLLPREANAL